MLSIGKLNSARVSYYVELVGSDDYYLRPGEEPGEWYGRLSNRFGMSGRVEEMAFRRILAGYHPATAEPIVAGAGRDGRMPGFDLTFSAPKSVSVLWALGDPETAAAVAGAHDRAVADTISMFESEAVTARRGHDGVVRIPGDGVIAAGFRHRTSRAGDPQLHTHVVIANVTVGADGRVSALDGRDVYAWAKTLGYAYQGALRAHLTAELGVEWGPVARGSSEILGVPKALRELFSARRAQITGHLERLGASSAKAAQRATLFTRPAKQAATTIDTLRTDWAEKAAEAKLALGRIGDRQRQPAVIDTTMAMTTKDGLTAHESSFDRRAVYRAVFETHRDGITPAAAVGLVDKLFDRPDIIPLGGMVPVTGRRYSTLELLGVETRMVARAAARANAQVGVAGRKHLVLAMAERPSLSEEQQAMVTRLTTSGAGVEVVIGKAGAGKTFALDAARAAWTASGMTVIGTAVAAKAALGLQAGAGIPSATLTRLLADVNRPESALGPQTVIVVDEAGMAGTRTLARLLDAAETANAKVVLVGDPRQLPEIDAGGALAALARAVPRSYLGDNRRQSAEWERRALDQLRAGSVTQAVVAYLDNRRVTLTPDAETCRSALVADWAAARAEAPWETAAMYAITRDDVTELNIRARSVMRAAGALTGPDVTLGGRPFAVGEQVLCLRNDHRLGITNGTTATLTRIDPDEGAVIRVPERGDVTLPAAYLHEGHLTHGYATTIHKAQGATVDRAFLLGSDQLYREAGYVGLSRARSTTQLYMVDPGQPLTPRDALTVPVLEPAGAAAISIDRPGVGGELARLLSASRAQTLAADQHPDLAGTRRALLADPPPWALTHLGPPPLAGPGRDRWADAATYVADYRVAHHIADPADPIGPEPADPDTRNAWRLARLALTTARHLDRTLDQDRGYQR